MERIVVRAPAKINLDLRVVGRRPDGYHELRTLYQSLALHDTVTLARRAGPLTVRSRSPALPHDDGNIVWGAAQVLWRALGRSGAPHGVAVSIRKVIPVRGGLGGGSSDAAAALRGLATLWRGPNHRRGLEQLAADVGSDVPYLVGGGLVLGVGRGVTLRRLRDLPLMWVVLAAPSFGVSTRDAYRWYSEDGAKSAGPLSRRWRVGLHRLRNDLEPPVVARHPDVGCMIARLRATGADHAAMTGSGSAVYALYADRTSAERGRRVARTPGWRTWLTWTLGRSEFEEATRPVVLPA